MKTKYIKRRILALFIFILLIILLIWSVGKIVNLGYSWYQNRVKYEGIESLSGKIKSGQDLFSSLTETGLEKDQAKEILNSLYGILDFTRLQTGD